MMHESPRDDGDFDLLFETEEAVREVEGTWRSERRMAGRGAAAAGCGAEASAASQSAVSETERLALLVGQFKAPPSGGELLGRPAPRAFAPSLSRAPWSAASSALAQYPSKPSLTRGRPGKRFLTRPGAAAHDRRLTLPARLQRLADRRRLASPRSAGGRAVLQTVF